MDQQVREHACFRGTQNPLAPLLSVELTDLLFQRTTDELLDRNSSSLRDLLGLLLQCARQLDLDVRLRFGGK